MSHRLAPQAEADLDDVWYYVVKESGSLEIAGRLIDSITNRFLLLARHP
jgi:toxin ParE1/3/4